MQIRAFTSSAEQFSFDAKRTFTVSHTEENGLAMIGTEAWKDYSVECTLTPGIHDCCGIIARVRGLRRYYGMVLQNENELHLIMRMVPRKRFWHDVHLNMNWIKIIV